MEVRVADAKTTAALERDGSLRCVLEMRYKHRDRHSVPAVAWARRKAEAVSRGLLRGAGLEAEAGGLAVSLNMVSLGEHRRPSYICYDLHLGRCAAEARAEIARSTRRPIHMISGAGGGGGGGVLVARRDPRLDSKVALRYEYFRQDDKGPRPYFSDLENPPLYVLGRRVEEPWGKDDAGNNVGGDDAKGDVEETGQESPTQH